MIQARSVQSILKARPTTEGAGVNLMRAFGFHQVPRLDPFLMLDIFQSEDPADYQEGFPWHPHRGIETITCVFQGAVEHADSLGNRGEIGPGDVQWMTAGRGILHQEMPRGDARGRLSGLQLWANLPARLKLAEPRYRELKASTIPRVEVTSGASVRIISGEVAGERGPVRDIAIDPLLLDITLAPGAVLEQVIPHDHRAFALVLAGRLVPSIMKSARELDALSVALYGMDGGQVSLRAGDQPTRILLAAGRPLGEPVAWYGPIVMNTDKEIRTALQEIEEGTFAQPAGARR